jgi:hypothetical protein
MCPELDNWDISLDPEVCGEVTRCFYHCIKWTVCRLPHFRISALPLLQTIHLFFWSGLFGITFA